MTIASAISSGGFVLPDPADHIRVLRLQTVHGANFWSRRPVTRLDLAIGAYEEIGSEIMPGFVDRLVRALPGLQKHHCSPGVPGGFIERLHRGTYVPHIVEHVAIELQQAIGHAVNYGRTRGANGPGEYTVVFEHCHELVGRRAAVLAVSVVRQAIRGGFMSTVTAIETLAAVSAEPEAAVELPDMICGISGGDALVRRITRIRVGSRLQLHPRMVVDVTPTRLLNEGIPYQTARVGVITDMDLRDVPMRYRDEERAARLLGVLVDGLTPHGVLVAPAGEEARAVHEYACERGALLATFSTGRGPPAEGAALSAVIDDREIVLSGRDVDEERIPLGNGDPVLVQVVAALTTRALTDSPL